MATSIIQSLLSEHLIQDLIQLIMAYYNDVQWDPYEMWPGAYEITNFIEKHTTPDEVQKKIISVNRELLTTKYHLHCGGRCGWTALEVALPCGNVPLTQWILKQPITTWEGIHVPNWFDHQFDPKEIYEDFPLIYQISSRNLVHLASSGDIRQKSQKEIQSLLRLLEDAQRTKI